MGRGIIDGVKAWLPQKLVLGLWQDQAVPAERDLLNVNVGNSAPIKVTEDDGSTGPYGGKFQEDTTPGAPVVLFSDTPSQDVRLYALKLACQFSGTGLLKADGEVIACVVLTPAVLSASHQWEKPLLIPSGTALELSYEQRANSPVVPVNADLDAVTV